MLFRLPVARTAGDHFVRWASSRSEGSLPRAGVVRIGGGLTIGVPQSNSTKRRGSGGPSRVPKPQVSAAPGAGQQGRKTDVKERRPTGQREMSSSLAPSGADRSSSIQSPSALATTVAAALPDTNLARHRAPLNEQAQQIISEGLRDIAARLKEAINEASRPEGVVRIGVLPPAEVAVAWRTVVVAVRGGAPARRLKALVIALDTWTYRLVSHFGPNDALDVLHMAYQLAKRSHGRLVVSDKIIDGLAKHFTNIVPLEDSVQNTVAATADDDTAAATGGGGGSDGGGGIVVGGGAASGDSQAQGAIGAVVPQKAVDVLCALGAMRLPRHFELHRLSHVLRAVIRGKEAALLRHRHQFRAIIGNFSRYHIKDADAVAEIVAAHASTLTIGDCGFMLYCMAQWEEPPLGLYEPLVARLVAQLPKDTARPLPATTARSLLGVYKALCHLDHPQWTAMYRAVGDQLVERVAHLPPRQVCSLLRAVLNRRSNIPFHPLHEAMARRVLFAGTTEFDPRMAGTAFIACLRLALRGGEREQARIAALFQKHGNQLEGSGCAAAVALSDLTALPAHQQQQLVQQFTSVALSVPQDLFALGLLSLSKASSALDPVSLHRLLTHAADHEVQRKLSPLSAAHILDAIATSRVEHPEVVNALARHFRHRSHAIDPGDLVYIVQTLDRCDALHANVFSPLTRVATANAEDMTLHTLLETMRCLATPATAVLRRGSAFSDFWDIARARVIAEGHRFSVSEVVLCFDAFSKLDVRDMPLFSVVARRLLELGSHGRSSDEQDRLSTAPKAGEEALVEKQHQVQLVRSDGSWKEVLEFDWSTVDGATLAVVLRTLFRFALEAADPAATVAATAALVFDRVAFALQHPSRIDDLYPVDVAALMADLFRAVAWVSAAASNAERTSASVVDTEVLHVTLDRTRSAFLAMYGEERPVALDDANPWARKVQRSLRLPTDMFLEIVTAVAAAGIDDEEVLAACKKQLLTRDSLTRLVGGDFVRLIGALLELEGPSETLATVMDVAWLHRPSMKEEDQRALTNMARVIRRSVVAKQEDGGDEGGREQRTRRLPLEVCGETDDNAPSASEGGAALSEELFY